MLSMGVVSEARPGFRRSHDCAGTAACSGAFAESQSEASRGNKLLLVLW